MKRLLPAALAVLLSACHLGLIEQDAPGTAAGAGRAADDFLSLLAAGRSAEAWEHLTAETREAAYDNDEVAFARDVRSADWSSVTWELGPITDLELSWGVDIVIEEGLVPQFLLDRHIASGSHPFGLHLLVQLDEFGYRIAAPGLDTSWDGARAGWNRDDGSLPPGIVANWSTRVPYQRRKASYPIVGRDPGPASSQIGDAGAANRDETGPGRPLHCDFVAMCRDVVIPVLQLSGEIPLTSKGRPA